MEKRKMEVRPMPLLAALVVMYGLSAGLLLLLSLLLGKIELTDRLVNLAVIFVYVISCFVGGWLIGKKMKRRQYLWGLLAGILYFLVLLAGNLIVNRGFGGMAPTMVTTAVICLASATAGGMAS